MVLTGAADAVGVGRTGEVGGWKGWGGWFGREDRQKGEVGGWKGGKRVEEGDKNE